MTRYAQDPDTGATYAVGGLYGVPSIDDARSDAESFQALLERRANLTPQRRLTARERDHNDFLNGWRSVAGKALCISCDSLSRPDVEVCDQCSNPLAERLESYQGVMPDDTVRCVYCNRMNTEKAKFCNSCANPINVKPIESKSRPRRTATPRRFQKPTSNRQPDLSALPFGTQLVARETFTFKTQAGRLSKVTAGITYVVKDSEAYKAKPSAFVFA